MKKLVVYAGVAAIGLIVLTIIGITLFSRQAGLVGISIPPNECDLHIGYGFDDPSTDLVWPKRYLCLVKKAKDNKDTKYCENIVEGYMHRNCITEVAKAEKDPQTCNLVRKETEISYYGKESFKMVCLLEVAIEIHSREPCNLLETDRDKKYCLEYFDSYKEATPSSGNNRY